MQLSKSELGANKKSGAFNSWFTQNLENLEKSWKKNHSGKLLEISWKNDLTLEK